MLKLNYLLLFVSIAVLLVISTSTIAVAGINNLAVVKLVQAHVEKSDFGRKRAAEESRLLFQRILDKEPDDISSIQHLGLLAALQSNEEEALAYWRKGDLAAEDLVAWGQLKETQGDLGEAFKWYERAVNFKPDSFEAWFRLGLLQRHSADWQSAIKSQQQAVALMPQSRDAWYELAWAYMMSQEYDEAYHSFTQASRATSETIGTSIIYYYIGYLQQLLAFQLQAWKAFETALKIDDYKTPYWQERNLKALTYYQRANILIENRQWEQSVVESRLALEIDPQNYPAHLSMAKALWYTKQHDEAKTVAQMAIELEPVRVNAYHILGAFFYEDKDFVEARKIYNFILALDPTDTEAKNMLNLMSP